MGRLGTHRPGGRRAWACSLAASISAAALAGPAHAATAPGCDSGRPAVAHHANGVPLTRQPGNPPLPCLTGVGRSTESADVGVGRTGSLFWAPLNENTSAPPTNTLQGPESVVRSRDGGATWSPLDSGGPATGGLVPPWMHVDPDTGRVWFTTTLATLCGARVSWSDDDGDSWQTNPMVGCPAQGANKLLEGPPPAGGVRPSGYPHVVYHCSNGVDRGSSSVYCYRSLDGGRTFAATASPDPPRPEGCDEEHPARAGIAGPDGVLVFPTVLCGTLGVAISRDEGATWEQRRIATTEVRNTYIATIAADRAGALYVAYVGPGDLPYLTASRDGGATWSPPGRILAPGITQVRRVAIAAGRPGEIALSYLGTTDGASYDGYVTESPDVLAARPRFWTATVNDPARPLVNGADAEQFGDRLLYQTDTVASDGTVFAGFHCARTAACPGARIGVMGRLLPPSNRLAIGRVTRPRGRPAVLSLQVPGAGTVSLASSRVRATARRVRTRRTLRLPLLPRPAARRALRRGASARVVLTYTPDGGSPGSVSRTVRLVRTKPRSG